MCGNVRLWFFELMGRFSDLINCLIGIHQLPTFDILFAKQELLENEGEGKLKLK